MKPSTFSKLFTAYLLLTISHITGADCPPEGFEPKKTLDLDSYINGRWYSMKQRPATFQTEEELYCTYAQYTVEQKSPFYCRWIRKCRNSLRINVFNRASRGLGGEIITARLKGVALKPNSQPSQLVVGPTFLPVFLFGDYWVVEAGTYEQLFSGSGAPFEDTGVYDWALIGGGAPDKEGENGGCFSDGLWFFSRTYSNSDGELDDLLEDPNNFAEEFISKMDQLALDLGYALDGLIAVGQDKSCYN